MVNLVTRMNNVLKTRNTVVGRMTVNLSWDEKFQQWARIVSNRNIDSFNPFDFFEFGSLEFICYLGFVI